MNYNRNQMIILNRNLRNRYQIVDNNNIRNNKN